MRLSATRMYAVSVMLLACTVSLGAGLWHGDAFWHLANGLWMIQHHAVLHRDIWSWTAAGTPWNNLEWGYDLLMGLTYLAAGAYGPIFLTISLAVATAAMADKLAQRAGVTGLWRVAYWSVALALLVHMIKLPPQMASYALFTGMLLLMPWIESAAWKKVAGVGLLFGMAWVNLHGSFILGFLIPVFFWVALLAFERVSKRGYLLWAGGFLVGTLITPNGPRVFWYVISELGNPLMTQVLTGWQSPSFHVPELIRS